MVLKLEASRKDSGSLLIFLGIGEPCDTQRFKISRASRTAISFNLSGSSEEDFASLGPFVGDSVGRALEGSSPAFACCLSLFSLYSLGKRVFLTFSGMSLVRIATFRAARIISHSVSSRSLGDASSGEPSTFGSSLESEGMTRLDGSISLFISLSNSGPWTSLSW